MRFGDGSLFEIEAQRRVRLGELRKSRKMCLSVVAEAPRVLDPRSGNQCSHFDFQELRVGSPAHAAATEAAEAAGGGGKLVRCDGDPPDAPSETALLCGLADAPIRSMMMFSDRRPI